MNDLDFRKWLTAYGISYEEYEKMDDDKKRELVERFNKESSQEATQSKADTIKSAGEAMQGCGCSIMLLPILAILIYFVWIILTS